MSCGEACVVMRWTRDVQIVSAIRSAPSPPVVPCWDGSSRGPSILRATLLGRYVIASRCDRRVRQRPATWGAGQRTEASTSGAARASVDSQGTSRPIRPFRHGGGTPAPSKPRTNSAYVKTCPTAWALRDAVVLTVFESATAVGLAKPLSAAAKEWRRTSSKGENG
jgi:hypothetical protein